MHAVWTDFTDYSIRYARSDDLGATWVDQIAVSPPGSNVYPTVAARGGKVAIAWYGADVAESVAPDRVGSETTWRLRYAENTDGGTTFSTPSNAWTGVVKRGAICTKGVQGDGDRQLGDYFQSEIDETGKTVIAFARRGDCPCGSAVVKQR
jgi:hypothetical protein